MTTSFEDAIKSARAKTAQDRFGRLRAVIVKTNSFINRAFDRAKQRSSPSQLASTVGFAGIVLFAPRLIAATTFYNSFRVGPSDVGLQFTDALGQAAVVTTICVVCALLALTVVVTLIAVLALLSTFPSGTSLLLALLGDAVPWRRGNNREKSRSKPGRIAEHASATLQSVIHPLRKRRHAARNLLAALATLIVIALQLVIIGWGWVQGHNAAAGHPVGPFRVFGVTLLDVRAEHVTIAPSDSGSTVSQISGDGACLLYLGQNSDVTVLYDGAHHRSIRVPSSSLIVTYASEDACAKPGSGKGSSGNTHSGGPHSNRSSGNTHSGGPHSNRSSGNTHSGGPHSNRSSGNTHSGGPHSNRSSGNTHSGGPHSNRSSGNTHSGGPHSNRSSGNTHSGGHDGDSHGGGMQSLPMTK